jgi:hypothetical protein
MVSSSWPNMKLLAAVAITAIGTLTMAQSERPEYSPECPMSSPLPPCPRSYAPVFTVHVTVEPKLVKVTYEASWDAPPDFGWLSDNDMPLNQSPIYQGTPVSWTYPRTPETRAQFGFFSLWREDGTRCDIRFDFDLPGVGRRPRL